MTAPSSMQSEPDGSPNSAQNADLPAAIRLLGVDVDEDLALTLPYVAASNQPRIAALYGLAVTVRGVPDAVSEAPIGEIRLQWQREALDQTLAGAPPKGHPVHEALAGAGALNPQIRALAEQGIDARARFLYGEPFPSVDDLFETLCAAEGWLAAALAHAVAPEGAVSDALEKALMALGGVYALARWGRASRPALSGSFPDEAVNDKRREAVAAFRAATEEQPLTGALRDALVPPLLYLSLARGYGARGPGAPWPVVKRLSLFRAMAAGRFI